MKSTRRQEILPRQPRHALDYRRILELHESVISLLRLQVVNGTGTTPDVKITHGNVTIILPAQSSSSATAAFAITELGHQDYFVARQLSNQRLAGGVPTFDVGSVDIKIAKVKNVRRSILTQSLYGDTVTYSDDDPADIDNTRKADKGTDPAEQQVCLPPYVTLSALGFTDTVTTNAQCVVYAKQVPGITGVFDDTGKALEWLEDCGSDSVRTFAERNPTP